MKVRLLRYWSLSLDLLMLALLLAAPVQARETRDTRAWRNGNNARKAAVQGSANSWKRIPACVKVVSAAVGPGSTDLSRADL